MLLPFSSLWSAQFYGTMATDTEGSYRVLERDIIRGIMILEIIYKSNKHKVYRYLDEKPCVKIVHTCFLLRHEQVRLKLAARDHFFCTRPELCNQCHSTERTTTTTTTALEFIHGVWSRGYWSEPLKDIWLLNAEGCSGQKIRQNRSMWDCTLLTKNCLTVTLSFFIVSSMFDLKVEILKKQFSVRPRR